MIIQIGNPYQTVLLICLDIDIASFEGLWTEFAGERNLTYLIRCFLVSTSPVVAAGDLVLLVGNAQSAE